MSKPVSQKQFQAFLREKPEWSRERASQLFVDSSYLSDEGPSDDLPITSVSWFSSRAYCEHYQMRLPTLIEWEYMASFPSKSGQMNSSDVILKWYTEPKGVSKNRIGSTFENQLGIWDLHGLVWEWIEDFNSIFVVSENRDPSSKDLNKFCGAGSLGLSDREDYASYMRFAFRSALKGRSSVWNLGFRCVVD